MAPVFSENQTNIIVIFFYTDNNIMSLHQDLMNEAYELWNNQPSLDYEQFLEMLNNKQRAAVVLGNFNYQVENGGFYQYHDNKYYTGIKYLRQHCKHIPLGLKVEVLVNSYCKEIQKAQFFAEDEDEVTQMLDITKLNKLDEAYYLINEEFMQQCEKYLETLV